MILKHLPAGNALARAQHGEAAQWTADTYLLALIGDVLQAANWQRAGDKNARRPTPLPRPGEQGRRPGRTIGKTAGVPLDVMRQRLGWE